MGFIKNIRVILGLEERDRFQISATEARDNSLFGFNISRERFIKDRIEDIHREIADSPLGYFSIMKRITDNYDGILPEIIHHLVSEGFAVKIIGPEYLSELRDEKYLIIAWGEKKKNEELSD